MSEKHPVWTRRRVGRDRVHWVAYDDKPGAEGRSIVAQGYATSLVEADVAARSALAGAGMYQSRRLGGLSTSAAAGRPEARRPARPSESGPAQPREYLYTRRHCDEDGGAVVCAHLILKKTARKVYVTQQSCWWARVGTEEERWDPADRAIALDRAKLESEGSIYSGLYPLSNFYRRRDDAADESTSPDQLALEALGLGARARSTTSRRPTDAGRWRSTPTGEGTRAISGRSRTPIAGSSSPPGIRTAGTGIGSRPPEPPGEVPHPGRDDGGSGDVLG